MRHRKFLRLAQALESPLIARGALEVLWDYVYDTGDDYLGTWEDIEIVVGWTGERGRLTNALADAGGAGRFGFIEPIDAVGCVPAAGSVADAGAADRDDLIGVGGVPRVGATTATRYRIHDLFDHAPIAVRRKRSRLSRHGATKSINQDNAISDHVGGQLVTSVRTPSLLSTEVQERETDRGVQVLAGARRTETSVVVFPVVGRGPSEWPLPKALLDEWRQIFPNLEVDAEVSKALGWIHVNPGRRKTASGMPRFLFDWLKRAVNTPRTGSPGRPVVSYGSVAAQNREFLARRRTQP
jgi:hypothetical protein